MKILKVYSVIFSLLVTALACELRETNQEIQSKRHVEEYINKTRPFVVANPRYRLHYHIAPPVGWINDPAGFAYYKENYHVFYEYNPFNTSYGKTHWGHVISKDLVTWTQLPIALIPEEELCFSGSAIEVEGTLVLMYTAHKKNESSFNETQYLAFSNDGVVFNKYVKNPVISFANNNSLDFRDPKVWRHGDRYYVVIGSRSSDDKGRVLLYKSKDMEYWEYVSEIDKNNGDLGYMWESPDFFKLHGRFVLLISPQGLTNKTTDRYQNQFQVGYIIGTFDYATGDFKEEVAFQELDYGHDFYTTQTLEHEGIRHLIGWMGTWYAIFPEREDGWAGAMTITRQLTLNGDRILMKPVQAIENLRGPPIFDGYLEPDNIISLNQTGELIITVNMTEDLILNIRGENDISLIILKFDMATKKVVLDRNGEIRQGEWKPILSTSWRVFLDASSIEVFCGEGEMTFTSRVYPNGMWRVVNMSVQAVNVTAYSLNRSVPL